MNFGNRDMLVEQIKSVGKELIDKADDIISPNMFSIRDFNIHIRFLESGIPEINVDYIL